MFLFFVHSLSYSTVYDWKHQHKKIKKYLELMSTAIQVDFKPAEDAFFIKNCSASFKQPTLVENESLWQHFEANASFPFNETKGEWLSFKAKLKIPEKFDEKNHKLRFIFDISRNYKVRRWDDDFPAGPEGRFWINNSLIAAIDEFHNGATINEVGDVEVRIFSARCLSEHTLNSFGVAAIDRETEKLYKYLLFIKKLFKELPAESNDRQRLMDITNEVLPLIDVRDLSYPIDLPDSRRHDKNKTLFYKSVPVAMKRLEELLKEAPQHDENDPFINVIGYSHLDTCWEWTYNTSHYKFSNTAATMLHLIDNPPSELSPQWRYLATSAQHYRWCEKDDPELYKKIIEAAKKGRWEVDGVSWVEPDTNLPCGESLVRQVLYGISFFNKLGFKQTTFFVPDCFGFSPALPQILKLAGIRNFVTSKISWNEYNDFPYHTFNWRGIDGSKVTAHFITTPCQWAGQAATYTGVATARELVGTYTQYKQKIIPEVALHTAGNGDGGGGVTEDMIWNFEILNRMPRLQGVPHLKFKTLGQLFEDIRKHEKRLPTWDGELYLEYHRGTATSQEEVKRQNRVFESLLHNVEWLAVIWNTLTSKTGTVTDEFKQRIDRIWEDVMMYQFHDAVPGTSVNDANVDILVSGKKSVDELFEIQQELAKNLSSLMRTSTEDNTRIVFNTLSHSRKVDGVQVPSGGWTSVSNPSIIKNERVETTFFDINGEEHKRNTSFVSTKENGNVVFDSRTNTVKTEKLVIEFNNETGHIKQITDRKTTRKYLKKEGNKFEFYEDRPNNWPAWDIQLYHKEMELDPPKLVKFEFKDNKVFTQYIIPAENETQQTVINQTISFGEETPVIDFTTDVLWQEHDKLLKVCFPTTIRSRKAKFGTQFGHQERPTHANLPQDMAMFETNGRWCDLSDGSGGMMLASDVKAGFDVHESNMKLSLLKAPLQTDKWADYGKRHFTYRLYVHSDLFEDSYSFEKADELNTQPVVTNYEQPTTPISENSLPMQSAFVISSNPQIVVETLKPAENGKGFICRMYEANGGWAKTTISFPLLSSKEWKVKNVNIIEEEIEQEGKKDMINEIFGADTEDDQLIVSTEFDAFEIKTLLVEKII